jgi:hypothetical protein
MIGNAKLERTETGRADWLLLRRYEREVAAYAAELRQAALKGQRGKFDRLKARLAAFEDECAAIAESLHDHP